MKTTFQKIHKLSKQYARQNLSGIFFNRGQKTFLKCENILLERLIFVKKHCIMYSVKVGLKNYFVAMFMRKIV